MREEPAGESRDSMSIIDPAAMTRREAEEILREEMRFVGREDILSGRRSEAYEKAVKAFDEEQEMGIGRSEGTGFHKV